jgi:hypothetical protein
MLTQLWVQEITTWVKNRHKALQIVSQKFEIIEPSKSTSKMAEKLVVFKGNRGMW